MSDLYIWLLIIGMGLITYVERASFIILLGDRPVPPLFERALRFVPAAVLAALVFPAFVYNAGEMDFSFGNLRLLAGIVAGVVAWRTRNILLTIAVGMGTLWALHYLLG